MTLVLSCAVVLAVMFVNGWTDAPNAISTVVITGVLPFRKAALLAAFAEIAGVLLASLICPTVAETVFSMVDLGRNPNTALISLLAALLAVVLWAVGAWFFGIPTSESHALLAGLTGAAVALRGSFSGISVSAWSRILLGLLLSTVCGWIAGRQFSLRCARWNLSQRGVRRGQLFCSFCTAFLHGAQDGQKLIAVLLLLRALSGGSFLHRFAVPFPLAALCAAIMSLGVLCGGRRIIDTVSEGIPTLRPVQGLSADIAGILCLSAASLLGLPVSTTHTRISATLGAGSVSSSGRKNESAFRILLVWLITFPCCAILAFFLARIMLP